MKIIEKKEYCTPKFRMIQLNHADIIATSDISAQSDDDDPEDISYGGVF